MVSKVLVLLTWAAASCHDLKSGKIRRQLLGNLKPEAPSGLSADASSLQTKTRSFTSLTSEYPFYHSTDEIAEQARGLVENCASPATLSTVNESGVSLDIVKVSSASSTPRNKVFAIFGEHSRELIGPETGLQLLEELCRADKSEQAKAALKDSEFALLLNGNPRSRRKVEGGDYCVRTNPDGVDLNRNWDEAWQKESSVHGQDSNPGPKPFSEPETRLIRAAVSEYDPTTFLTVHSGTLGLYMPWAYDMSHLADRNQQQMMSVLKSLDEKHCKCPFGAAGKEVGYSCPGTSLDWVYDKLKTPYSFAFEIFVASDRMESLRERWHRHSDHAVALLQAGHHLASPHTKHIFEAHPSDFVQLSANLTDRSDRDCFGMYNPSNEELYRSTVTNWVTAYMEMAAQVADSLEHDGAHPKRGETV